MERPLVHDHGFFVFHRAVGTHTHTFTLRSHLPCGGAPRVSYAAAVPRFASETFHSVLDGTRLYDPPTGAFSQ